MDDKNTGHVLIIGAGIAGINAALQLAESGTKVYLCERRPYIGGTLLQMDKWFPDHHCGMCQELLAVSKDSSSQYCFRQGLFHPNITTLLNTEVKSVSGEAGNFQVALSIRSNGIKKGYCTGCGICEQVCPVNCADSFNSGIGLRKAIYLANPFALSKSYTIDFSNCNRCGQCVQHCPSGAIDLSLSAEVLRLTVKSIIVSTGFEEFDPAPATAFGYQRFPNVITSLELERLLSSSEPTRGTLSRPSDGKIPRSIAFLQCVGSRSFDRDFCSAACCMFAIKEAIMIKEAHPETEITIHCMDIRDFGKGCFEYQRQARDKFGINFSRCRVPAVRQNFRTQDLLITSIQDDNTLLTSNYDMVVLSIGQNPSPSFRELCQLLDLDNDDWGFCVNSALNPVETQKKGVFVCGSASGPKDITDTIIESTAAAGWAACYGEDLNPSNLNISQVDPSDPKTAVLVCNCYRQLSGILNFTDILNFSQKLPSVVYTGEYSDLCQSETLRSLEKDLLSRGINRVVLAGCSGLRSGIFAPGLPVELVDIREQLAWVHQNEIQAATGKARILVRMAAEKLSGYEFLSSNTCSMKPRALVVGGGLAGLTASLNIAEKGFEVELIERTGQLGGNANYIYSTLHGDHPVEYIRQLIEKVTSNPLIHFHSDTELVLLSGYAGSFNCILRNKDLETAEVPAGAIIIATGAQEYCPDEYLYGQSEQVITQRELEARLFSPDSDFSGLHSISMIQCVGSRCDARPYCSRVCCSQALKNALLLKQRNPDIEITVFYRDLMAYGMRERFYTRAREQGIRFVRYEQERKPVVSSVEQKIKLSALDTLLGNTIEISPDLVVLSPAIVPPSDNTVLARTLGVDITAAGFFKEAEPKFRPVDMLKEGIFVCGLAHSPRDFGETIIQAQAAVQRAVTLLSRPVLSPARVISTVNPRRCSGCEQCIRACPYQARVKDYDQGIAQVIEHLCQGCGVCVTACPNGAAGLKDSASRQIFAMMDAAIQE